MIVEKTSILDLQILKPNLHVDNRGYFLESFKNSEFELNGLPTNFVQQNQSKSTKDTLRGLHYQKEYPQGKVIQVLKGEIFDVAVDINKD